MNEKEQSWTCWITGTPRPSRSFGLSYGGRTYDRNFKDKRLLLFKAKNGTYVSGGRISEPFVFSEQTPLEMLLLFFHKKPKKPKTDGERWKITTPDLDNCAYLISNALKSTIFPDDRQIVSLKCEKKVHPHFEGILIKINALQ